VLLIDEIDRADEAFEAYLLEVLSDFQSPFRKSRRQVGKPADRDHHVQPDARNPRCAQAALPLSLGRLSRCRARDRHRARQGAARARPTDRELVAFVQRLRKQDLFKSPGVAETLDWASALDRTSTPLALDAGSFPITLGSS